MPHGRKRPWKGKRSEPFPRHINRFVRPCLLLLLHRASSHGYSLIEDLKEFGFERCPVDASMVYRSLRDMEEQGLVVSHWDTEGPGPPRRVYRLKDQGDQYLARWVADLRETDRVLHNFFNAYDEHMQDGEGEHH